MISFTKLAQAVQYPNEDWNIVGSTVVTGLVVVFLILIILVIILTLMGMIMGGRKKKTAVAEAKPEAPAQPTQDAVQIEGYEDDGELIAVISAAIAAYGEADGKQYRVVGIKKKDKGLRSGWNLSGVAEQTRPF